MSVLVKGFAASLMLSAVSLSPLRVRAQSSIPLMKYECSSTITQESPKGKQDSVIARTKKFFITEKDYEKGINLRASSFSEFVSTGPQEADAQGLTSFKGTDMEKGFTVWISVRGTWTSPKEYKTLGAQASLKLSRGKKLTIASLVGNGKRDGSGVIFETSGKGRPEKLEAGGTVYLQTDTQKMSPIHFNFFCKDTLNISDDSYSSHS